MPRMTDPLSRFDRAAAVADSVIGGIRPDQMSLPTPCSEWTVRHLLNHVVGGTALFAGWLNGEAVDRDADFLGNDPHSAFHGQLARLRALFTAPGGLQHMVRTPLGELPGMALMEMRTNELVIHSWDLARATGQPTDLDPELAETCAEAIRKFRAAGRGGGMFAAPQPVADAASAADRLAALAGRTV